MSDLAPFVAAALRDKTVLDLQQELQAEKEKNKAQLNQLGMIFVTGAGGSPVYAQRHFEHAEYETYSRGAYELKFLNSTPSDEVKADPNLASCPIQELEKCELHIGGKEVIVLGDFHQSDSLSSLGDTNCCLLYEYSGQRKICLVVDFGPNTDPDSGWIWAPEEYRNEDIEYVRFTRVEMRGSPFEGGSS